MLFMLIDKGYQLDEVVFYDTGMEFQSIYETRDKVLEILKNKNIKYTELHPKKSFEYTMFEKKVKHRNGSIGYGYSWCGGRCRWGTSEKNITITKYLKSKYGDNYMEYVGIAYDELKRIKQDTKKIYPLCDFEFTEKKCLAYCREKGFNWLEDNINLYNILDRVSCWCCANKNLKELRNYYKYLPKYWNKLKEFQKRTTRPFKNDKTIFELEERFKKEIC